MRRGAVMALAAFITVSSVMLGGCGEAKEAKAARLKGIEQVKSGDYAGAVESFELALEKSDGVVNAFELDILKYRGEAEFMLEDYTAAAHTYGILADVDSQEPEYLYYKAAAGALSGDPDTAAEDYSKAAEAAKDRKGAENGALVAVSAIAQAYRTAGSYESAAAFCQQALDSGITGAELYNQMGLCMMAAKRYDEAVSYFDQGIAQGDEEKSRQMMYNMGAVYESQGDFAKALETFRSYASQYGSTPELEKEITFLESR